MTLTIDTRRDSANFSAALILLLLTLMTPFDSEADRVQTVDPKSSKLSFSLVTPLAMIQGTLRRYTAELKLNEKEISKSQVSFRFRTTDARFEPSDEGLDLTPLLLSLPPQEVVFESTAIEPMKKAGTYKVRGKFQIGGKKGTTSIPVLLERKKGESIATVSMKGNIDDPNGQSPIPLIPGQSSGGIKARLVFR